MSDPIQEQLLGHLFGALEQSEEAQLAARLESDPHLQSELSRLRTRLEPLQGGRYDFVPPAGLAERTCRLVAAQAETAAAARRRARRPAATPPLTSVGHEYAPPRERAARFRWVDVAVAAGILVAASLLTVPAIQSSRFNAQILNCQDNLRQIGVGLRQYSLQHDDYFPSIPTEGNLAAAGIFAPTLARGGYVTESRRFVCPGSPLAATKDFSVPSFHQLRTASRKKLDELWQRMGGSYGYHLGHVRDGVYHGTKNLRRTSFALAADTPGSDPSDGRQSRNHGGRGQNVLFECGRVRFVTSPQPNPQADHIFINYWGLVAPGLDLDDAVIGSSAARPVMSLIAN